MKRKQNLRKILVVYAIVELINITNGTVLPIPSKLATAVQSSLPVSAAAQQKPPVTPQPPTATQPSLPTPVSTQPKPLLNPCNILGPKGNNSSVFTTHFHDKLSQFSFYNNCKFSTISITNLAQVTNKPNQYTFTLNASCKTYTTTTQKTKDSKRQTETHCTTYHYSSNYTANTWLDSLPCTITCGANNSLTLVIPGHIGITIGNDGSFNNNHKLKK
jgi:hypothetical protein